MLEKLPFKELQQFREESILSEQKLYGLTKQRVIRYRAVFFTIGLIFFLLAWIIDSKSALWLTSFLKPIVELFAILMGIASFSICVFLRYETESVRALYHHSVGRLKVSYKIRKAHAFKDTHLPISDLIRRKLAMRAHFTQAKEQLKRHELDTLDLMGRITNSDSLSWEEKETLYNQALLELKNLYIPIIQKYEETREKY